MTTLAVGETSLLENLEEDVEHVGVRLLDLVEEHDGVRTPPDGLGELAALVIAHVSGRGTDELGDGVLLHELGHVEADERILAAEEELGERLGELGLAHARGAEEDERATGATRVLEGRAGAADGLGDLRDCLLLPDDPLVKRVLAAQELGRLGLGEVGDGHAGHGGDHVGDVLLVDDDDVLVELGAPVRLELVALGRQVLLLVAEVRRLLVLLRRGGRGLLVLHADELGVDLGDLGREAHAVHARARAGLVEDVDGLVGQEAVLHVAAGEGDRGLDGLVGVLDMVVLLVALLQALDDLDGVLGRGLADVDRLEAALEGGVLLDVLAVLLGRGGADDLDLAAGERRLEDRGGIDGALGGTSADDGVDLVDEEDVLVGLLELVDDLLHAVLELAAVLGAGDETGEVERPDLLAAEDVGDVARGDELREALDDGRLAHARVAEDERVVLLTAGEHLHDALDLAVAADDGVELAVGGELGEVAAVLLEHGALVALLPLGHAGHEARVHAHVGDGRTVGLAALGDELVDGVADGVTRDAHRAQGVHGAAVALGHDAEEQVLGGDVGLAVRHGLAVGVLEDALGTRSERDVAAWDGLGLGRGELLHRGERLVIGDVELGEGLGGYAVALLDEGEEQVLGAHVHLPEIARLVLGETHDLAGLVCELLEHVLACPSDCGSLGLCLPTMPWYQTDDAIVISSGRGGPGREHRHQRLACVAAPGRGNGHGLSADPTRPTRPRRRCRGRARSTSWPR